MQAAKSKDDVYEVAEPVYLIDSPATSQQVEPALAVSDEREMIMMQHQHQSLSSSETQ